MRPRNMKPLTTLVPWDASRAAGYALVRGRVIALAPAHWSGMLSITEAAAMLGRKPTTIRQWLHKARLKPGGGWLKPDGLDEQYRPLFWPQTLRDAEAVVRQNGITGNGSDPRRARVKPAAAPIDDCDNSSRQGEIAA